MKQKEQSYIITITDVPPSQNIYKNWHWAKQRKEKIKWEYIIRSYSDKWGVWMSLSYAHKVTITFYFPDKRRRDKDNYVYFKGILDGLKNAGMIRDDSEKEIDVVYPPLKLGTGERKTVIELEAIR